MCRLTAYKGKPILIGAIVTKPNNSLLYQSRDAAYHPGVKDDTHHRNILVNGDGFGLSWYNRAAVNRGSCTFKFVTPAWSNQNLQNIGDHVTSGLIFAHIRAASSGKSPLLDVSLLFLCYCPSFVRFTGHNPFEKISVNHENCHPFTYSYFTFMHNGGIPHFASKIKRPLLNLLSETFFQEIKGSTDTEHIFALFLTILFTKYPLKGELQPSQTSDITSSSHRERHSLEELIDSLNVTISTILSLCSTAGVTEPCSFNICVTDGLHMIATRFRNGSQMPPSLYYNYGSNFVCENGTFYPKGCLKEGKKVATDIVISSAPLSRVDEEAMEESHDHHNLSSASMEQHCHSHELDPITLKSEENIGSWILLPKDTMLICYGDALNPFQVSSIAIKPILSTEVFPGYAAYVSSQDKKGLKDNSEEKEEKVSSSHRQKEEDQRLEKTSSSVSAKPVEYFPLANLVFNRKPVKILKFRSKL
jgi:glutamine amidotransferase